MKKFIAGLVILVAGLAQAAVFTEDFTGVDGDPWGPAWTSGATDFARIQNNEGYFTANPDEHVVGTGLSSANLGEEFSMSVDFRMPAQHGWGGLWFLGDDEDGASEGGYAVRFRTTDGLMQCVNFLEGQDVNTGGWGGNPTHAGELATDGTRYRLQLGASLDPDGTTGLFDVTLTNLDDEEILATHQFTRNNAFVNPATGDYSNSHYDFRRPLRWGSGRGF